MCESPGSWQRHSIAAKSIGCGECFLATANSCGGGGRGGGGGGEDAWSGAWVGEYSWVAGWLGDWAGGQQQAA